MDNKDKMDKILNELKDDLKYLQTEIINNKLTEYIKEQENILLKMDYDKYKLKMIKNYIDIYKKEIIKRDELFKANINNLTPEMLDTLSNTELTDKVSNYLNNYLNNIMEYDREDTLIAMKKIKEIKSIIEDNNKKKIKSLKLDKDDINKMMKDIPNHILNEVLKETLLRLYFSN